MTTQPSIAEVVCESVAGVARRPVGDVRPDAKLMDDLGIRSFGRVELVVALEDRLGIAFTDDQVMRFRTVADIIAAAERG